MSEVTTERLGSVAVVRIDRPKRRNALSLSTLRRLDAALRAASEGDTGAVVLTGTQAVFSAGADLVELGRGVEDLAVDESIAATVDTILSVPVPVAAAVEGPCLGAAFDLLMACDVRIAGEGAFFSVPATRLGILYEPAALARLFRVLGRQTIARLLLFGEQIDATGAAEIGIIARVVPTGAALSTALELAERPSAFVRPAVEATRELLVELEQNGFDLDAWQGRRRQLLSSTERMRAVARAREEKDV